ncbi:malonate decarboxylase holo-[acyl-carrier-protein] synthase [Bordetella genomosp. 10]|uniref:Malonate decarboxylase holo-[acyl-carrier-protein] synthase n=1 Tax=Bordetella genomosp. 10 TaxID=1416804 RepID=A0A261S2V6_9BORD|nr:malonate decarboxylase holo-[acyl-carrier-protein] synthase [Bordetella genomosp. 10]OZI30813.1 malonate decarboxylase holo-[acyl-carrier-protein] synthase [Bordetella genomosp. 10]
MPDARLPQRHTLAWADPSAWDAAGAEPASGLLRAWAAEHRPLVVRRRIETDPAGSVPLGLPLPPEQGKKRLFTALSPQALHGMRPMPALDRARANAPTHWQSVIDRILAVAPDTRVFGSLAWEYLTGLPYLSDTSDLDLLFPMPASAPAWHTLGRELLAIDSRTTLRIDGECVRADGVAVKWRELAGESSEVLLKTLDGAYLMPRAAFMKESFGT